jgi:hypothetical protein
MQELTRLNCSNGLMKTTAASMVMVNKTEIIKGEIKTRSPERVFYEL